MVREWNVQVVGPLAPYAAGFKDDLVQRGYRCTHRHLYLMAHVSQWLRSEQLKPGDLSAARLGQFNDWRVACGYAGALSISRAAQLLDYLEGIGVVARVDVATSETPIDRVMTRYTRYLASERGLAPTVLPRYVRAGYGFLSWLADDGPLADLNATTITRFVRGECQRSSAASVQKMATRLRSLLRFFYLEGLTPIDLSDAVPRAAGCRSSLPPKLGRREVARLLERCDRATSTGRRDYAVLVVLSRLGLRASEVARLELGDVDWRHGEVVIRGKAHRRDLLPLPCDVGDALVAWLQQGRPPGAGRSLFTRVRPPFGALSSEGVSSIVRSACQRAELSPVGAHALRHNAATRMLHDGASLREVGQVLRHRSAQTTAVYAKVDRRALVAVVRPWPGVA